MRKKFAELLEKELQVNNKIFLYTGDLGYHLWDNIRENYSNNFFNVGSAEQLMIGAAVGSTLENKISIAYSITPFLLYRPFEFIRNYLHYEQIPVKLVASGRDNEYEKMGYTHLALEEKQILNSLPNIKQYYPNNNDELVDCFKDFLYNNRPCYINLKKSG